MTRDTLISHIAAQAPDMPHHKAAAYLHEFMLRLQTDGKRDIVILDSFTNEGYAVTIPDHVISVSSVYANGDALSRNISEDDAMSILRDHADDVGITNESGTALTNESDEELEI